MIFSPKRYPRTSAVITHEERPKYGISFIHLLDDTKYEITIHPSLSKRLSSIKKPCLSNEQLQKLQPYSKNFCQFDCMNEQFVEKNFSSCYVLDFSIRAQDGKPGQYKLCSYLENNLQRKDSIEAFFKDDLFQSCEKSCLTPCELWHYDYTIYTKGPTFLNRTELHVVFNPRNGIIFTEEIPTYSWDTLLSNIGGQLGLWMGGSIISLFQIIYFLILYFIEMNISKKLKLSMLSGRGANRKTEK